MVIIWFCMLFISSTLVLAAATAFPIFQLDMYLGISLCWRAIFCLRQRNWVIVDIDLAFIFILPDQIICIPFFFRQAANFTLTQKVPMLQRNLAL